MNNIYKILSVVVFGVILVSCSKNSNDDTTPIRDYAEQYATDLASIDDYIDTHFITVNPSNFDVTFNKIPDGGTQQSIRNQTQYPLKDTLIAEDGIKYKVYYIRFREGTQRRPTQVDSTYISYKGVKLTEATNGGEDVFDTAQTPVWFKLQEVITGWSHIIPNFKTGTYAGGTGGNPITYDDYGAGVMFLPSGLAYYNNPSGNIPSYSPIIFSFKLLELRYRDHDGDGILSKDERNLTEPSPLNTNPLTQWCENPYLGYDYNGDGTLEIYDTDKDGVPNMYDIDDDGDHYTTRSETKKTAADLLVPTGPLGHYPFNPTSTESKGVPNCGNSDFSSSTRLRKYLDPTCHFQE
jgi:hypothetical protein